VRRTWEWVFVGLLLPYRCVGCDRRFLNFSSAEASRFPLEGDRPSIGTEHIKSASDTGEVSPVEPAVPSPPGIEEKLDRSLFMKRDGRGQVNGIRALTKPSQRRKDRRQKSDPQVIGLQVRMGDAEWLSSTLLDASEGGIGVSLTTPLTIGSTIAARGKIGETRSERVSFATVKWCSEITNGNYQAGLEFDDEFDYYEILQLSPNAEADTIERVYRLLAQRYHPHQTHTGNLEMFLKLYEAHRVLSEPEQRAEYDTRRRETKSFPGTPADRMRIREQGYKFLTKQPSA